MVRIRDSRLLHRCWARGTPAPVSPSPPSWFLIRSRRLVSSSGGLERCPMRGIERAAAVEAAEPGVLDWSAGRPVEPGRGWSMRWRFVAGGAQFASTVQGLVAQGYKMIFATSYGYVTPALAAKYPQVKFEQATGSYVGKNVSEYFGASEDTIYLSGIAAGAASKNGKLGYVVAFPTPEVIRDTNAFALGAQLAHPGATVRIVWTHSWFNPPAERRAAQSLHQAGADVLGQDVDSPSTGQYAESVHVPWVGYDSDASKFAPKSWLTASVTDWGPYYLRRVKAAMNGTWKPGFYYGTIGDGFTKLAPYGPGVSAKTKAMIAAKEKQLAAHRGAEFTGPLYDQRGKLRIPKGKTMTVQQLYAMSWLVKGVIGSATG